MHEITKIARHLNTKVALVLASILLVLTASLLPVTALAAAKVNCDNNTTNITEQEASQENPPGQPSCCGQDSSFDSSCDLVNLYINPAIDVFSGLFGLIAVISLILGGIQYSASAGDPQKAGQAKDRISKTIFAIFAYFFLYAFLQFIVPGGAFNRSG